MAGFFPFFIIPFSYIHLTPPTNFFFVVFGGARAFKKKKKKIKQEADRADKEQKYPQDSENYIGWQ
ncbi:hypothetical protein, partial [Acinetobacter baumannii]|uniref:hypothetical protein n=1 Tax=Acinetobacter baumannii TaxID=470 RepID=UPI001BB46517